MFLCMKLRLGVNEPNRACYGTIVIAHPLDPSIPLSLSSSYPLLPPITFFIFITHPVMMCAAVCVRHRCCSAGVERSTTSAVRQTPDRLENNGLLMRRAEGGGGITMATGDAITAARVRSHLESWHMS